MVQQRLQLIVALEKLEDTKVVTRSRKAKKNRQLIIQWPTRKTDNRINNDTPNFTKDQTTGTPLNTGGELSCSGRFSSSCSTCSTLYISNYCIFLLKILWYCLFCAQAYKLSIRYNCLIKLLLIFPIPINDSKVDIKYSAHETFLE
jgi:hypothetical protein